MLRVWMLLLAAGLLCPATAAARDQFVTSFDGTKLNTHFFVADGVTAGERAPTVMLAHGFAESAPATPEETVAGMPTPRALLRAGYNVLTWDARGHGSSTGSADLNDPDPTAVTRASCSTSSPSSPRRNSTHPGTRASARRARAMGLSSGESGRSGRG